MPQLLLHYDPASAQGMEDQLPNGRAVLRYVGHTWAFKWPVLAPVGDTVEFNKVIESSDRFIVHNVMQEPHQGDAPSTISQYETPSRLFERNVGLSAARAPLLKSRTKSAATLG